MGNRRQFGFKIRNRTVERKRWPSLAILSRRKKSPNKIGFPSGILDRNGRMINYGDSVIYGNFNRYGVPADEDLSLPLFEFNRKYRGIVTRFSRNQRYATPFHEIWDYRRGRVFAEDGGEAMICLEDSMWYGDDPYSPESYGKSIFIHRDQGDKMSLLSVPD